METFILYLVLISPFILSIAVAKSVCYEDIGCFDNGYPFYDIPDRPISWLPQSREEVGTSFRLNTRNVPDPEDYQTLDTASPSSLLGSDFSASRETKVITHGFIQGARASWMMEMVTAFLDQGDYNVVRVNWRRGALGTYGVSAANARIVGAELSLLIDLLKEHFQVDGSSFHLIGHSLGAHVMGYAGERQHSPQVARITGLDPAGPYFEDTDPVVRLDPTDAAFVDVIHSDTDPIFKLGYGMYAPCGHMDFFPNGGTAQPGCDNGFLEFLELEGGRIWEAITQVFACNHLRAIDYFVESIYSACPLRAFQCTRDLVDYNYGLCFNYEHSAMMGIDAPNYYPGGEHNIYQINTKDVTPFCGYQYLFTIKLDDNRKAEDAKGQLFINLVGSNGHSSQFALTTETQEYYPNTIYLHMGLSDIDVGTVSGLIFEWEYDTHWYEFWDWFSNPKLFIHSIQVTDHYGTETTTCGDYEGIEPSTQAQFITTSSVCPSE